MIMPPPTPVPSVTMIILRYPTPPPFHISPSAATFASFPNSAFSPVSSSSSFFAFLYFQPRFAEPLTIPSAVTGAGTPTPIPRTCSFSMPCCSNLPLIASAISGRIADPSSSVLVTISHFSTMAPASLNRPSLTVVPPISTPKQYFISISPFLFIFHMRMRYSVTFVPHPLFLFCFIFFSLPDSPAHVCTVPVPHYIPSVSVCG